MTVIVTVSKNGGIAFNHRRQSSDRVLTEYILASLNGKLIVSPYTADLLKRQIPESALNARILVADDPMKEAGPDDVVFPECKSLRLDAYRINELVIANWNRDYPSDMKLDIDLGKFEKKASTDIKGNSHEKITITTYQKKL